MLAKAGWLLKLFQSVARTSLDITGDDRRHLRLQEIFGLHFCNQSCRLCVAVTAQKAQGQTVNTRIAPPFVVCV